MSSNSEFDGFILTRQWVESGAGIDLIFWLASKAGPLRLRFSGQEAVCFFPTQQKVQVEEILASMSGWRIAATQLKNFDTEAMSALYLKSQRKLYDIRDRLAQKDIRVAEADLKPTDRFLMERFITAAVSIEGSLTENDNFNDIAPSDLRATEYRPQLSAVSIDIETDYQASTLYSIAIYSDNVSIVYMVGPTEDSTGETDDGDNLQLYQLRSEREVISAFVKKIGDLDPDVIMGWNIVNFDLRCLQDFCDRLKMPLLLGRNNEAISWRKARDSNDRFYALLPGRAVLDGIELMRSATYQFENFSLEYVSRQLLDRGKLVDDVDQRGAEITELFSNDKPALARYNLEDCRLVWDIFQKEALISFAMERSLLTGLELDRYGGSVAAFDFLYLPRLHRKGFVAPHVDQSTVSNVSPGGYVMGSIPGIHQNVIVLDFKSLYPSIIRTFHVDPLALAVAALEENPIEGYDGGKFSRVEFILPELISTLWSARDKAKVSENAVLSQAIKIIMNSFYGILGTVGCRFLDSRLVSSITKRGHEILIQSKNFIEDAGYQVIYGDTDSVFVLLGSVPIDQVKLIGDDLTSKLNEWWTNRLREKYDISSFLEIEFETHFSKFLMPTVRGSDAGSKKRYAGLVVDSGNPDKLHLLFKGLESVRSDWSPLAREFQKELYRRIFFDEPYEDYIKLTVQQLGDGKYENELVLRKRLRRKLKDYVKNVPPHAQAARKAEDIRRKRELPSLYQSGGWIEYIMTINGAEPRQYRESAIDYEFYLERQLAPIADSILVFKSSSMDKILNNQIGLF
ncbi:MAG: DNA polymerase II [SAR86 cluster bacterium]|uniref:DNA polymerase n=1 Tax=SAR86 cluster bacterium TaxID=2030880 RepID=A0A2A4X5D2_9GAMM|nr:MAG: DNA polymerase II [SAR86 cluster bacterium]